MSEAKHTPGALSVVNTSPKYPGNFRIENNTNGLDGEWDDIYVSFSGYYGSYGPYLFAAAPELLEALKGALEWMSSVEGYLQDAQPFKRDRATFEAAIAKAEGRSP